MIGLNNMIFVYWIHTYIYNWGISNFYRLLAYLLHMCKVQEQVYQETSCILFSGGWAFPSIMHCLVEKCDLGLFSLIRGCPFAINNIYILTWSFRWWRGDGRNHEPIEHRDQQWRARWTESSDCVASAMSLIDANQWLAYGRDGQAWSVGFSLQCGIAHPWSSDHGLSNYGLWIIGTRASDFTSLRTNVCYLDILI